MKKGIHPQFFPDAKIACACGNTITTGSTNSEMKVEVCSACHPFYTGKKRLVDSTGQVDRFRKRMEKSEKILAEKMSKAKKRSTKVSKDVKSSEKKKSTKKK